MSRSTTRGAKFTFLMQKYRYFRYLTDGYVVTVHGTNDILLPSWKTQTWPRICKLAQNWATLKKYFFYCLFYCLFYCTNIVEIHVGHRISPCRLCWKTGFIVLLLYKYMLDTISTAICTIVLTVHVEHHNSCLDPQILAT